MFGREDIYRVFGDKDVSYVFNRVVIDPTQELASDIIKVRGSLLQEDLGVTQSDAMMIELLLGDQYIKFYQHIINLEFDKRSVEDKLESFTSSLYKWLSQRLGYIPEWVLPNREDYLLLMLDKLLEEGERLMTDSEVLLALLLKNTRLTSSPIFKEQLRVGVWSSTVTGGRDLELAEEYYIRGQLYKNTDSLSLYVRLAERGYRSTDILKKHVKTTEFKDLIVSEEDTVFKGINDFMWKYAQGEKWSGYTEQVYTNLKRVQLEGIEVSRPNPNQIQFTIEEELGERVLTITYSNKVSVTYYNQSEVEVLYNREYYVSSNELISGRIDKSAFRNRRLMPVVSMLIRNLPIQLPTKEKELDGYT